MIQEDKELLLRDLSARLPYRVKVLTYKLVDYFHNSPSIETLYGIHKDGYISTEESDTLRLIDKPYLLPLSSMTPKQKAELVHIRASIDEIFERVLSEIEFYHKHHIDYRGLIEMGLAIDATGLNIY